MKLQRRIENYLRRTQTAATRFGEEVLNDRSFVFELRRGRRVGKEVATRVHAWLDRETRKGRAR